MPECIALVLVVDLDEVRVSGPSLPSSRSGPAVKGGPAGPSEASREAAPSYGGCDVKRAWLIVSRERLGLSAVWLRLAGRSGRPRVSRRSVNLICGGWVPQDLVSSHVRCLDSSAAPRGAAQRARADWGARVPGGSGRLASRNGCR
jgi:hypothetical protein